MSASGLCGLRARNAFLVEQRRQFTRLEHFAGDVAASDELALYIELRNCRPVGIGFNTLADLAVRQDIDRL